MHPGEVLREEVLPALRIALEGAAGKLGVSRQTQDAIMAAQAGLTAEIAVRLGKFCGNGAELWLRLQNARDLWQAQHDLASVIESIPRMRGT
jgi:addiction module HigA family antidote